MDESLPAGISIVTTTPPKAPPNRTWQVYSRAPDNSLAKHEVEAPTISEAIRLVHESGFNRPMALIK